MAREPYTGGGYYHGASVRRASRRRLAAMVLSLCCHGGMLVFVQLSGQKMAARPVKRPERVTRLVAPDPALLRQATVRERPKPLPAPALAAAKSLAAPQQHLPVDKSKVDPSKADIDLQYSTPHLADIIAAFGGYLAFGDPKRPDYINARFRPPDWQLVHDGAERRDYYVTLEIESAYPFLEELRRKYGLQGQKAYALFDFSFSERMLDAIREKAAEQGHPGPVTMARIWIGVNPARIEVKDIEMGTESKH